MQFIQLIVHPASSTDKREKCLESDVRRKIRKLPREVRRCLLRFWLIWFINQRALYNHTLSIMHRRWHCHLCTTPPGTGLDIEALYFVYICTYTLHVCTSDI